MIDENVNSVALPLGTSLRNGRYRINDVLGAGGFGITYQAHDATFDITVAIKEYFPSGAHRVGGVVRCNTTWAQSFDAAKEDFLREARALARLSHPNVVHLFDHFDEHNTAYMVMEYLAGQNYAEMLRERGRFGIAESCAAAEHIAAGLTAIHAAGLVHRDLKPANVIATYDGRVVLVDFGAARNMSTASAVASKALVSNGYSPVEQYSAAALTPASDIYALAATVYEFLTGIAPPPSIDRVVGTLTPRPDELERSIPSHVCDAVMAGLAIAAPERPQTAGEFVRALAGPTTARTPDPRATTIPRDFDPVPQSPPRTLIASPSAPNRTSDAGSKHRSVPLWAWASAGGLIVSCVVIGVLLGRGSPTLDTAAAFDSTIVIADPPTTTSPVGGPSSTAVPSQPPPVPPPPPVVPVSAPTIFRNGRPCPTTAGLTDGGFNAVGAVQIAQFFTAKHHVVICEGPRGLSYFGGPIWFDYDGSQDIPDGTALLNAVRVGQNDYVARKGGSTWYVNTSRLKVTDPHRVALDTAVLSFEV